MPKLSQNGQRIVVVCNDDLLNLGNNFNNREGVFVIEEVTGSTVHHLISGLPDKTSAISGLTLSANGANLTFQDANTNNAFRLDGLSSVVPELESTGGKSYPVPFILPGSGKSGLWFLMNIFIFVLAAMRIFIFMRR